MTDWVSWFRGQLQASADGFIWAFTQLPAKYHNLFPPSPDYMGTWQPVRHLWHVTEYERCLVIPSMLQWVGGALPDNASWQDDDAAFARVQAEGFTDLADHFRDIRRQQIEMLDELTNVDWEAPRETLWGQQPLKMVVTKTYQHTFEHGDTLLRMALWWARIETSPRHQARQILQTGEKALDAQDFDQARRLFMQGLAQFQQIKDEFGVLSSRQQLGLLAYTEGNYTEARTIQEEILQMFRQRGYDEGIATTLRYLGLIALKIGEQAAARGYLTESQQRFTTAGKTAEAHNVRLLLTL